MRYLIVAITLVACDRGQPPAEPDAVTGAQVTGCDDSALWSTAAVFEGRSNASVGGDACSPAQYPLHRGWVGWWGEEELSSEERNRLDRTCWRVTAATPGSGWNVGDTFEGERDGTAFSIKGFDSTITVDGRVLRDDGTVMFALAPVEVELDPAVVLDADAAATTFVTSPESWMEPTIVHAFGTDAVTDEIVAASGASYQGRVPFVVHRTANGFVRRTWSKESDTLVFDEVALGSGTRARTALLGQAVVIDAELVRIRWSSTQSAYVVDSRTPLAAEPSEIGTSSFYVSVHVPGSIDVFGSNGTKRSIPVGDGVLVPTAYNAPDMFFDGTSFREIESSQSAVSLGDPITPSAEDLATIGPVRGLYHGILFGERGMLHTDVTNLPGPRTATFAELFGDPDARLGPVSSDTAAYVVRFGDGNAKLYNAPYVDYCGP